MPWIKRRWAGSSRCCFCVHDETIQHLFLDCPLAKLLWRSVHIVFNIIPPVSIEALFGTWLNGVTTHIASSIRIGICAFLWAIWNCRNDMIFNRLSMINFLQVIFRATAWIRTWSLITPTGSREQLARVQPVGDGSTGYIQPVWMAVY